MTNRLAAIVVVLSWSAGRWHSGRSRSGDKPIRGEEATPRGPALFFERAIHSFNSPEEGPLRPTNSDFATPPQDDDQTNPPAPLARQHPVRPANFELTRMFDDEEETSFTLGTSCSFGGGEDSESSDEGDDSWETFRHSFMPSEEIQADPALLPPRHPDRDGGAAGSTADGGSRDSTGTGSDA